MSDARLGILILEDNPADAELMTRELRQSGLEFESQRVDTEDAFRDALEHYRPAIVLADYRLPGNLDGMPTNITAHAYP